MEKRTISRSCLGLNHDFLVVYSVTLNSVGIAILMWIIRKYDKVLEWFELNQDAVDWPGVMDHKEIRFCSGFR